MHKSVGAGRVQLRSRGAPAMEEFWQRLFSSSGTAPRPCRNTKILPAIILCAGHNLPNKTTGCCLPPLFQIIHLVLFWWFFSTKLDREKFNIFCQTAEKSSVQNLEVLLLLFSHTDSKPIIPSLISILWTVCSFEQVFCFLSYLYLCFLTDSCEEFCHRPFVSLNRSCQLVFVWLSSHADGGLQGAWLIPAPCVCQKLSS